jgi:rhamnose transport system permease protein
MVVSLDAPRDRGAWLGVIARQRELSLVAIMVVLGALVSLAAPQFLTVDNISQVAVLASIVAVAAVGEALVVITRNVDLSVEAMMGLVAYCVAVSLENHTFDAPGAILFGISIGLVLGMINGFIVTVLRVPAIVATLGTLSIFRGIDYYIAGAHQVQAFHRIENRLPLSERKERWGASPKEYRVRSAGIGRHHLQFTDECSGVTVG